MGSLSHRTTQATPTAVSYSSPTSPKHLEELQEVVRQIRGTIFDLTPTQTPRLPVQAMLNAVITELTGRAHLRTTIRIPELVDELPDAISGHTRAVIREA